MCPRNGPPEPRARPLARAPLGAGTGARGVYRRRSTCGREAGSGTPQQHLQRACLPAGLLLVVMNRIYLGCWVQIESVYTPCTGGSLGHAQAGSRPIQAVALYACCSTGPTHTSDRRSRDSCTQSEPYKRTRGPGQLAPSTASCCWSPISLSRAFTVCAHPSLSVSGHAWKPKGLVLAPVLALLCDWPRPPAEGAPPRRARLRGRRPHQSRETDGGRCTEHFSACTTRKPGRVRPRRSRRGAPAWGRRAPPPRALQVRGQEGWGAALPSGSPWRPALGWKLNGEGRPPPQPCPPSPASQS